MQIICMYHINAYHLTFIEEALKEEKEISPNFHHWLFMVTSLAKICLMDWLFKVLTHLLMAKLFRKVNVVLHVRKHKSGL